LTGRSVSFFDHLQDISRRRGDRKKIILKPVHNVEEISPLLFDFGVWFFFFFFGIFAK
jgi:hypothetical protein